jgi:hypothetical protein
MEINVIFTVILSSSITSTIAGILLKYKFDRDMKRMEYERDAEKKRHETLQNSVEHIIERMWESKSSINLIMESIYNTLISSFPEGFDHDPSGRETFEESQTAYYKENGRNLKKHIEDLLYLYGKHEHIINNLVDDEALKKRASDEFMKCMSTDVFENDYYYKLAEGYDDFEEINGSEEEEEEVGEMIECFKRLQAIESSINNLYSIVCQMYNPSYAPPKHEIIRKEKWNPKLLLS